ncbi:MAG: GxxExxY protein [Sphingobacteriaceae bacterium]|jgi:GxxExxY protein
MRDIEDQIGNDLIDSAIHIHRQLGPGLFEKVYETCLAYELEKKGYKVVRQLKLPIEYNGVSLESGFVIDLLINDLVIIELKAAESYNKIWEAQLMTYLKLSYLRLGYIINFNVPLVKNGIKRIRMN